MDAVERYAGPLLRGYLEAHRDEIAPADLAPTAPAIGDARQMGDKRRHD